jgi:SsrA-binding protein
MNDSHAYIQKGELFLANLHIAEYSHGNRENHEPLRTRKLLVHRQEITRLAAAVQREGFTLVPLSLYFKSGRVKVELGIAKGKKLHDKRASIKERDVKREMAKATKRSR